MTRPTPRTCIALVGLLVVLLAGACGSQQGAAGGSTTIPSVPTAYRGAATLSRTDHHRPRDRAPFRPASRPRPERLRGTGVLRLRHRDAPSRRRPRPVTAGGRSHRRPSAPYRTRILVRRPTDPARFNGTVVVEWMNVSAGESAPDWDYLNPMLMRDGYAYVAVSAQALAVNGGAPILGSVGTGSQRRPGRLRAGPLRAAPPSRRPVRAGHLRPDRPGPPHPTTGGPGRSAPDTCRGRRRVPVGLLPDHVRRRHPAADPRLRRHLHPQSGRIGGAAQRIVHHLGTGRARPVDPHRPRASPCSCSRPRPI